MFKKILVALKFSPASIYALKKGLDLARVNAAELHIFHALDYSLQGTDENNPKFVEIKKTTETRYKNEIAPLLGDLKKVTFKSLPADPALEVCKLARAIPADLIVLGCHQISEKISMGRLDYVGVTILEKAPCPVMLVPFNARQPG
jgi:nucleotide-binding universal stress UspA family protein